MKIYSVSAIAVVVAHLVVSAIHGLAHRQLGIELSPAQKLFVLIVITITPLIAMILLAARVFTAGFGLLVFSMISSLIFGFLYHFVISSPDHVLHIPRLRWGLAFRITAALLAVIEVGGLLIGVKALLVRDRV